MFIYLQVHGIHVEFDDKYAKQEKGLVCVPPPQVCEHVDQVPSDSFRITSVLEYSKQDPLAGAGAAVLPGQGPRLQVCTSKVPLLKMKIMCFSSILHNHKNSNIGRYDVVRS